MGSISHICSSYFNGFRDLSAFNDTRKNCWGLIKVASYCTLVMPLFFGFLYAASSLVGRITSSPITPTDEKTSAISRQLFGPNLEQELQELFTSPIKAQKLFIVDGVKIGVIYNPKEEVIDSGIPQVHRQNVMILSNQNIPRPVHDRLINALPRATGISRTFVVHSFQGHINGQSILQRVGFEE